MVPDLRRVKREKSLPTGDKVNIKQTDLHLKSPETHKLVMQLPLVAGPWMEAGGWRLNAQGLIRSLQEEQLVCKITSPTLSTRRLLCSSEEQTAYLICSSLTIEVLDSELQLWLKVKVRQFYYIINYEETQASLPVFCPQSFLSAFQCLIDKFNKAL